MFSTRMKSGYCIKTIIPANDVMVNLFIESKNLLIRHYMRNARAVYENPKINV